MNESRVSERAEVESHIRACCTGGDLKQAATLTLTQYGGEIYSLLLARLRAEADAQEVYSIFAESLWRGLPGFEWRSTMRTYCYSIACNAAARYVRAPALRPERNLSLPETGDVSAIVAHARTQTATFLRTEARTRLQRLRDQLPPDDQLLLVLRVDRGLRWDELVLISSDGATLAPEEQKREAGRLRKRFQTIKATLQRLAEAEGLL